MGSIIDIIQSRQRSYSSSTNDLGSDTPQNARFIGNLQKDKTRLNVASALTERDLVDFFYFRSRNVDQAGLSFTSDGQLHIQILEKHNGRIVADSEAIGGDAKTNWDNALAGKLDVKEIDYVIAVRRGTGVLRSEKPNYLIQLMMGTKFKDDYETIERPQPRQSYSVTPNATNVANVIGTTLTGGKLDIFA